MINMINIIERSKNKFMETFMIRIAYPIRPKLIFLTSYKLISIKFNLIWIIISRMLRKSYIALKKIRLFKI